MIKKIFGKIKHKICKDTPADLRAYYYKCLNEPVDEKAVLFESFGGLGILDNPRAVFKEMLKSEEYADFTYVWTVSNKKLAEDNIKEFSRLKNVKIVLRESKDYYKYLATAKYLFNNSAFSSYFVKRDEQIYTNTWHGIPTKYMGYEHTKERVENARGIARNAASADYLLGANQFMIDRMYKKAYLTQEAFKGEYLNMGYPRLDAIHNTDRDYIMSKLSMYGLETKKKIVLYAPTWKGQLYNKLEYNLDEFKETIRVLKSQVPDGYEVLLRVHYFIYKELSVDEEFAKILVPFTIDTNELLSVVDILISDYSSIFFDFLWTRKPVIFFVPDYKEYTTTRGLYVPMETLPGPIVETVEEASLVLKNTIESLDEFNEYYKDKYNRMIYWCSNKCESKGIEVLLSGSEDIEITDEMIEEIVSDVSASKRICDKVFKGEVKEEKYSKKHKLFYINWKECKGRELEKLKKDVEETDLSVWDLTILTPVFTSRIPMVTFFNKMIPEGVRILTYAPVNIGRAKTEEESIKEVKANFGKITFDEVKTYTNLPNGWKRKFFMNEQ